MRKLPSIPPGTEATAVAVISATVQSMTGQTDGPITQLATTATTSEIITKVNEILARIQGT
jgi:hypothetical protein